MNSKHNQFHLPSSGHHDANFQEHHGAFPNDRPDPKVDRAAYERWYHSLTDEQKHAEWQRYHRASQAATSQHEGLHSKQVGYAHPTHHKSHKTRLTSVAQAKKHIVSKLGPQTKSFRKKHGKPLLIAGVVGFIFLTLNYNHIVIGQVKSYISPGKEFNTPVILDPNAEIPVSSAPKIVIPKINVDVPVVYDEKSYDEGKIQKALEGGVVHYGESALPGQIGNNVIVGHSSNNFFNSGKYKFAFVLLDRLEVGDTFVIHYGSKRYIYKVFNKQIVAPNDFSLIQTADRPITSLITCTPPGTSWRRLVVQAEQIVPDPLSATATETQLPKEIDSQVPGSAPSLWQRIWDGIF
ncbi:sortase [Candidatus Saccharibacteria bacterium CPR2]|nr:sortase [Candidatus Saccharibacteria bacterium CPR2]